MLENNKIEVLNKMLEDLSENGNLNLVYTVPFMVSDSYKDRLIGEYVQLKIRYDVLTDYLETFETSQSELVLKEQLEIMKRYIEILEKRTKLEDIKLPEIY